jgi:cell division protein FtsQ
MTQVLDAPRPGPRPPVDPRFRRRWAEARRAEGRRRLRVILALVAVVVLVAGGVGALHSPLFRVRDVTVVGSTHTPRSEIVAAAGLAGNHALMLGAGSTVARRALEALPWVGSVSFARHWPWTVLVTVRERTPAAVMAVAGGTDVVDASGRVLEVLPGRERQPALPVVEGAQGALAGRRVSPADGTTGAQLDELLSAAATVPESLARRSLRLAYAPRQGLVAYLGAAKTVVMLGDPAEMAYKWAVLAELASRVALAGYSQVDLTVPQRPALSPPPNSGNS